MLHVLSIGSVARRSVVVCCAADDDYDDDDGPMVKQITPFNLKIERIAFIQSFYVPVLCIMF